MLSKVTAHTGLCARERRVHRIEGCAQVENCGILSDQGKCIAARACQVAFIKEDARHFGIAWLVACGQRMSRQVQGALTVVRLAGVGAHLGFGCVQPCRETRRQSEAARFACLADEFDGEFCSACVE